MNKQCCNCKGKATRFIQSKAKYFCNNPECLNSYVDDIEYSKQQINPIEPTEHYGIESFEAEQRRLSIESIKIIKHKRKKPKEEKPKARKHNFDNLTAEDFERINSCVIRKMLKRKKFGSYQEYMRSKEWQLKSKLIKRRDGFMCRICKDKHRLMAHHLNYKRLYCERPNDLITLCGGCHDFIHDLEKVHGYPLVDAFYELCDSRELNLGELFESLHISWYDIRRPKKEEYLEIEFKKQVEDFESMFQTAIERDK